ncbi:hypothetical protein AQUCO_02000244v1 [Aquilegia coerulea]|uniref:Cyanobacterial aminoacyl-tRNA synthetase CAAD domain-containing protein n=2 Tax=Aquilegia coerulea TaxID=218851 RepID=A0A2G5DGP4_AQUCA|nr:hypothetical protein AQUCO_02000244v1 [Aquilegia coerulea]PIA42662.1 hypothetical protein AQUCO_02000244v1 [Aquilegia coerulea]PIA42663.1 hypothetical protein AQUCO_02000244v1 [Aquilegia coerulea]
MASITIGLLSPPLLIHGRKTHFRNLHIVPVSAFGESQKRISVVVKATGESSESSLNILKSVQNIWDKSEDRIALVGLGFTGIVALWASTNLVVAIDKLPLIPSALELIGILFSSWFVYRYLLFKPDREELSKIIKTSISDILGQ